jgi:SSS family solute:Na+ symporter
MSSGAAAFSVITAVVGMGSAIGFLARGRHRMDLEQWTVGGRGFGLIIVWLMMAGEIYTIFAFLGASGWAYSKGGPSLYIMAYLPLGSVFAFFLSPAIWDLGQRRRLQTQADFFQIIYGGRLLSALVALVGIAAIIPYLQLQLTGLGIIVSIASFGGIGRGLAMTLSAALIAGFVLVSGIRAVAGISMLKDLLMIGIVVFVGVAVPRIHFGGVGAMFARLAAARPGHLAMPGAVPALGHGWYISMVLLSSLGQIVWPHAFASIFSAKSGDTLRRNAIILPLYNLTFPFVFFAGFAALLVLPGMANGDLAFMAVVKSSFPPWFLGLVGGAGALAAMVPASVMLLTASTLFAKNLVRPILAPSLGDAGVAIMARSLVVALTGISLLFALQSSMTLVGLLQLGYGMAGQFFPGIVMGLAWKRARGFAVLCGILSGLIVLAFFEWTRRDPVFGVAAGFLALGVNVAVAVALCLLNAGRRTEIEPYAAEPAS